MSFYDVHMDPISPDYLQIPLSKKTLLLTVLLPVLLVGGFILVQQRAEQITEGKKAVTLDKATVNNTRVVNEKTKSGVFTLEDVKPSPNVIITPDKQVLVHGDYNMKDGTVKITTTLIESSVPPHEEAPRFDSAAILLRITGTGTDDFFETYVTLGQTEGASPIPFEVLLPYFNNMKVVIYNNNARKIILESSVTL